MTGSKIVLCGENNPHGSNPEFALYNYPPGCAGHRLYRILGLPEDQYLALHRKNLCDGDWSKDQAKKRVFELLSADAPWRVLVLLGRKVTETFEKAAFNDVPLIAFATRAYRPGMSIVSLPHPSGRNAALWNAKARARARQLMRDLVPDLPWGSLDAEEASA